MADHRLLLIEDDHDLAEMLGFYFRTHDYQVLHADDGATGIEIAQSSFPHLILLDIMLPDMEGYEVCQKLRQITRTKYIPILFLTQKDGRSSKVHGLELGADDYITKPFDIDELRLRVQRSIRRATKENYHESRTGLPTGPLIDEELNHKLDQDVPFRAYTYQLQGFRAYHDVYGFVAARETLNHAGKVIQTAVTEFGTDNDFVGILDDEFIVLTHAKDFDPLDTAIKTRFSGDVSMFYTFIDAERGGLLLNPDTPQETLVPLMVFTSHLHSMSGDF